MIASGTFQPRKRSAAARSIAGNAGICAAVARSIAKSFSVDTSYSVPSNVLGMSHGRAAVR
jgi:hypothetical protein